MHNCSGTARAKTPALYTGTIASLDPDTTQSNTPASAIDLVIEANHVFAENEPNLTHDSPPSRKLLIIACMDARINIQTALGLSYGDAHILRNAGGTVTDDVLRSAIVSTNVLGTREIMVINHTHCGMTCCTDHDLRDQLTKQYGPSDTAPTDFFAFTELNHHVRDQVAKLRNHGWIPRETIIRGFTYDVHTGRLHEVDCA